MINTRPEEVAEIVIGNHLASLALFSVSHSATETLIEIEDMKKGLTKKLVEIFDRQKSGDKKNYENWKIIDGIG